MPNYADAQYWDDRYKQQNGDTTSDWLETWADLKEILEEDAISKLDFDSKSELQILNLGCGNSILAEEMYDDGYKSIWNVDISKTCIQ